MALEIEDGTGKANAQSVASAADLRAYADARGVVVPSDDSPGNALIEQALINAMDYLSIKYEYQGEIYQENQALPFPRKNVVIKGVTQANNYMPKEFKTAQIRLGLAVLDGTELLPNISGSASDYVIKEKVGPIETEYADPTKFDGTDRFTAIDSLLFPLLIRQSIGALTVYRA